MANQTPRYDGWTLDRKLGFLAGVITGASVGAATKAVGLSRTAAYALARRDPGFADAWAQANDLAHPHPVLPPPLFETAELLPNAGVMHQLRRYNIGRGRTFLPR